MGVIVDTSIWIDVERGLLTHTAVADSINNEPVYITPPVIAELQYGAERAKTLDQKNKRASALAKIKKKPCLTIDQDTGEMFGKLAAELDNKGAPSSHRVNDVWIAALAIQHGLKILTQNESDFRDIPGLEVVALKPSRK